MIPLQELRIGNLVYISNDVDNPISIATSQFYAAHRDGLKEIDYRAIPLTEEWLLKFGFEKDRTGWNLPSSQFSLTDKFYPCLMDRMLWPQDVPHFKHLSLEYVHQLQNLHFAIMGKELEIKPQPNPTASLPR